MEPRRATLEKYLRLLRDSTPPVDAVAIGGSEAIGEADRYSDVDLFVLLPSTGFFDSVLDVGLGVATRSGCSRYRYEGFVQAFGFTFTLVEPSGVFVDLFFNCEQTLPSTPMTRKTRVLFDRTGAYSERLTAVDAASHGGENNAVTDVLVELDMLRKHGARREMLPLLHHVGQFRVIVMAIDRLSSTGQGYSPYGADCRIARDLGDVYEQEMIATVARADPEDVRRAVDLLVRRATNGLHLSGCLRDGDTDLISTMTRELNAELTSWARHV